MQVLQAAKYLASVPATFEEGDWDSDGVFDQLDIVAALQTGFELWYNLTDQDKFCKIEPNWQWTSFSRYDKGQNMGFPRPRLARGRLLLFGVAFMGLGAYGTIVGPQRGGGVILFLVGAAIAGVMFRRIKSIK